MNVFLASFLLGLFFVSIMVAERLNTQYPMDCFFDIIIDKTNILAKLLLLPLILIMLVAFCIAAPVFGLFSLVESMKLTKDDK